MDERQLQQLVQALTRALQDTTVVSRREYEARKEYVESMRKVGNNTIDDMEKRLNITKKYRKRLEQQIDTEIKVRKESEKKIVETFKAYENAKQLLQTATGQRRQQIIEEQKQHLNIMNEAKKDRSRAIKKERELVERLEPVKKREAALLTQSNTWQHKLAKIYENLTTKKTTYSNAVVNATIALKAFVANLYADVRQITQASAGFSEKLEGTSGSLADGLGALSKVYGQAIALGMKPAEYAEMMKQNREVVLALGGQTKVYDQLYDLQQEYYGLFADNTQSAKFFAQQMTSLAELGIQPSIGRIKEFTNIMAEASKISRMMPEQFGRLIDEMSNDIDVRYELQALNERERMQRLKGLALSVAENRARGLSVEQIREQNKVIQQQLGMRAIDRFKQAAKIQALGGAIGAEGTEEAARIVRLGRRASPEQKDQLRMFQEGLTNAITRAGTGTFSEEIFADSVVTALGMEDVYGKGSPFNTTLVETMKPQAEALANMTAQLDKSVAGIMSTIDKVGAAITGTLGAGFISVISTMIALQSARTVSATVQKLGRGKQTSGSKLAKVGKGVLKGGIASVAGLGVELASDYATERGYEKTGAGLDVASRALTYGGTGAAIGSIIPGIGTAVGAGIGGVIGTGVGLHENWAKLFGGKNLEAQQSADETTGIFRKQLDAVQTSSSMLEKIASVLVDIKEDQKKLIDTTKTTEEKKQEANKTGIRLADRVWGGSRYTTLGVKG